MGKKQGQVPVKRKPRRHTLTWKQERFVEAYIRFKGNGTAAAIEAGVPSGSASTMASKWLGKVQVQEALEQHRAYLKELLAFSKEDGLAILIGMATATMDHVTAVLKAPGDRRSYKGLGYKRYAIESAKETFHAEGGVSREIKLISNSERRAAINDLWEKLGLDKGASQSDRVSFLERFASLGAKLGRPGGGGGQSGGEGSK